MNDNQPLILDGNMVAAVMKEDIRRRVQALQSLGIRIGLGTILIGNDTASIKYVDNKHSDCRDVGIDSISSELPATVTQEEAMAAVNAMNADNDVTGFILQLPVPGRLDESVLINAINPLKDADGLTDANMGRLATDVDGNWNYPTPCTAAGVIRLLDYYHIPLNRRNVCIVGRGRTAGRPLSMMMTTRRVNASVDVCHTGTGNLPAHVNDADIVISAVGKPWMIDSGWFNGRTRPVLVNVGVSRILDDNDNKWHTRGDISPDCKGVSSAYSPAAGGVGPMTRIMLMDNVVRMAERNAGIVHSSIQV